MATRSAGWTWGLSLAVMGGLAAALFCRADELQMRDGTKATGTLVAADDKTIVFRSSGGLLTKSRDDVRAVFLGEAAPAPGGPPPGVSADEPLKIVRWTTFRRITHFQTNEIAPINNCKLSADGSKVIFSTYGATFVVNADGSGLTKLSDKRNEGLIDISADAKKVVWYDGTWEGFVANSDGSGRVKLPGGFQIQSLRMTARGDRVIALSADQGRILALAADGSDVRRITGTAEVAKAAGVDENNNHWRGIPSGLDISDDGSRIVFHFLWDAFAVGGDGTGLRRLTQFQSPEDRSLYRVRISGNGRKVAWHNEKGAESTVTIEDWSGGGRVAHTGMRAASGNSLFVSQDAAKVAMSWGARLYETGGDASWDAGDFGLAGDEPKPLHRANVMSLSADGRRACLNLDIGPSQLVIVDFNPPALNGVPRLEHVRASPRFLLNDGSTNATLSAQTGGDDLQYVGATVFRDGWRLDAIGWPDRRLNDDGREGDEKAKDGTFSTDQLRFASGAKIAPGPVTLRFFAFTKAGHALAVDVEGVEARQP